MKKVLLCVLDGVGYDNHIEGNAFKNSNTPNLDKLIKEYPNTKINASGTYVGLPDGQMGNSEVGHLTIGAGRIIYQSLELINRSIRDNTFYDNRSLLNAINHAKKNNSKLHLLGLLSDGGVHSHIEHIKAVLNLCKKENFSNVYLHIFTDGRDTYKESSINYIKEIEKCNIGTISTISGRFYAMDRDKRYDRVEKAYNAMVLNQGNKSDNYEEYIKNSYKNDVTDEFIEPVVINEKGNIQDNDSIIWCNFRPDRAIEILSALTNDDFDGFKKENLKNIYLTTMMYVSDNINGDIAFKREEVDNALGIYLSKLNKKQLRIAETEKYAHVTYFFDGGKDIELPNEKRILIPSPKVPTYDMKPEMSANEITDSLLKEMDDNYDFIFLNFANGDMVGHTGNYDATIKAVETIDLMLGKIYDKCMKLGYTLMITADHGNCECMVDNDGNMITSHTSNKVPFIITDKNVKVDNIDKLSDIAPFVLKYLDLKVPSEMTN
ncbi:MAG: 2,3-bisphosphoglycerate-independent phosphoglycerate mutase [Bacilli bacterium]|nr:2,3-bisphosphoglycerate-independent phosphoglycerate mutase [Bacilli bacterium]MBO6194802.1 2,3-bisphosphoglycerate-independent phosphoglycerate mutase [Bacilli bacterium]